MNPVELLIQDHKRVMKLFEELEATDDAKQTGEIGNEIMKELEIHTKIEEELFYPPLRETELRELINEAFKEHDVAEKLISDAKKLKSSDEMYEATMTTLKEAIEHHVEEEEGEMFPKVPGLLPNFEEVGDKMAERKEKLMSQGTKTSSGKGSRSSSSSSSSRSRSSKAGSGSRSR